MLTIVCKWVSKVLCVSIANIAFWQPMGWTSEMVAQHYQVPRKKQDEYAYVSHSRAAKVVSTIPIVNYPKSKTSFQAQSSGVFAEEIIPINLKGVIISEDDTIRPGVTMDGLSALKPVFPDWGHASTTAGNASGVGDGAGICILTTRAKAQEEGMEIVGKYVASTVVGEESSCSKFRRPQQKP
jgi:acetyl-CoA acetyltransferase